MPSSLLNAPHPDTVVTRYDLVQGLSGIEREEQERKARKHYLDLALQGDPEAKLLLKTHPMWRMVRWWRRGIGEIL